MAAIHDAPQAIIDRLGFKNGLLAIGSDNSDSTTPLTLTVSPSAEGYTVTPIYFRIVSQCAPSSLMATTEVYIERYAWADTPGTDAPIISTWTPLTPYGAVTALGLISGARHWEWESAAPLEVAALSSVGLAGSKLHVRFESKASSEGQYIAINYRNLLAVDE